jgi:hypothetical protein
MVYVRINGFSVVGVTSARVVVNVMEMTRSTHAE